MRRLVASGPKSGKTTAVLQAALVDPGSVVVVPYDGDRTALVERWPEMEGRVMTAVEAARSRPREGMRPGDPYAAQSRTMHVDDADGVLGALLGGPVRHGLDHSPEAALMGREDEETYVANVEVTREVRAVAWVHYDDDETESHPLRPQDLMRMGLADRRAAYKAFSDELFAASLPDAEGITDMTLNPVRHLVEVVLHYPGLMDEPEMGSTRRWVRAIERALNDVDLDDYLTDDERASEEDR